MYDAPHQRVKKVSITLECTPGFHQTQCEALEGACPERMRSFRERSLSALWKAGFGFPDLPCASEAAPLLRAFTQVPSMRSACALANFHGDGRCLPPPSQNPMARDRPIANHVFESLILLRRFHPHQDLALRDVARVPAFATLLGVAADSRRARLGASRGIGLHSTDFSGACR